MVGDDVSELETGGTVSVTENVGSEGLTAWAFSLCMSLPLSR